MSLTTRSLIFAELWQFRALRMQFDAYVNGILCLFTISPLIRECESFDSYFISWMLWCCHFLNKNIINLFSGYISGCELSVALGSSHRWKIFLYTKTCFLRAEAKYSHHIHYNCVLSGELFTCCWIFDGLFSVRLDMCLCSKENLLNLCREHS